MEEVGDREDVGERKGLAHGAEKTREPQQHGLGFPLLQTTQRDRGRSSQRTSTRPDSGL